MKKKFSNDLFLDALFRNHLNRNSFAELAKIPKMTVYGWDDVDHIKKREHIEAIERILGVKYEDLCVPASDIKVYAAQERLRRHIELRKKEGLANVEPVTLSGYESEEYDHDKHWPIIGSTRGGAWIENIESGYAGIGEGLADAPDKKDPNGYALRVLGDSMAPKFAEGGIVLVSPNSEFISGQFAVVIIESRLGESRESCVKQVFKHKDHITLRSLNPKYKDIDIPTQEVIAIHKVIEYRYWMSEKFE